MDENGAGEHNRKLSAGMVGPCGLEPQTWPTPVGPL